jgi:RIO kinase 1
MDFEASEHPAIESFLARGLIREVLHPVKSGKEATVFCCRAGSSVGAPYAAAKVYRPREHRSFRNDARYQEGRWCWRMGPTRAKRAFDNKSHFGHEVQAASWVGHEWATLGALHAAGVDVPRPIAEAEGGILMEFFGDEDRAAAPLAACSLEVEEAQAVLDRLVANVERMLARNVVHGDLSAYNVLLRPPAEVRVIDLPQAVDPRFNSSALAFLRRDLANVHRHCVRFGARGDADATANDLWRRFMRGEL